MSNTDHSIAVLINTTTVFCFAFVCQIITFYLFVPVYLTGSAPLLLLEVDNWAIWWGKNNKNYFTNSIRSNGWQTVDFGENIPVT